MEVKYKVIIKNSLSADGLGNPSISVYYGGCDKKDKTGYFCEDCQNKELQVNPDIPSYYNEEIYNYIIQFLDDWHDISDRVAVSFIGGEPLAKSNRKSVKWLSERLKNNFNYVDTVLYTWRTKEDLIEENIIDYVSNIDKCVCGEYIKDRNDDNYVLGSTNQYIYNFRNREVILKYEEK